MITVEHIADHLGRTNIARMLGVGATSVSNAVVANRFPSSWFVALSDECAARGVECPPGLFGMKGRKDTAQTEGAP